MKKPLLFFILLSLASLSLSGQKIQYGGLQQLGFVVSERQTLATFTMINGIRFYRFFTGFGINAELGRGPFYYGYDTYNNSAIFVDARYYINKSKNFFTKLNGGVNYISHKPESYPREKYERPPGYYGSIGLGFKAKIGKEIYYSFDLNYGMKQTRLDHHYLNFLNEWQTEKFDLRQSVITLNMGIEIF